MVTAIKIAEDGEMTSSWQLRVRPKLESLGSVIAGVLAPGVQTKTLDVYPVKTSATKICYRVRVARSTGFLKLFDGDGPASTRAYERERDTLIAMSPSKLVPRLRAYSDPHKWLLMEDVSGVQSDIAAAYPAVVLARMIGAWIAAFETNAPCQSATGNWFNYLRKLGLGRHLDQIDDASSILSDIPLCGLVLSRNDPALHNYLLRKNGRLLGCDFENATLRPRGWEYITTWQALMRRYPENVAEVTKSFSEGFGREHRGALIVNELNSIARILFCAQLLQSQKSQQEGL